MTGTQSAAPTTAGLRSGRHHRWPLALLALGAVALHGCASGGMGRGAPVGTRAELRHAIDSMVAMPKFSNAHWGVLIVDPERGDTLYSRNAGKLFMPASNQKIVTGAVALTQLGPDFQFETAFAARGTVEGGVLRGDLVVLGNGDPEHEQPHARRRRHGRDARDPRFAARARGCRYVSGRLQRGGTCSPTRCTASGGVGMTSTQPTPPV